MARKFRRRFMGRRFGKPFQREKPIWTSNVFNETGVNTDGTIQEFTVLDALQLQGGSVVTDAPAITYDVRRIIIRGGWANAMANTSLSQEMIGWGAALYVIDRDDTDNTLATTVQGNILEGGVRRLLWTDFGCSTWVENGTTINDSVLPPMIRVEIDIKPRFTLQFDEVLVLGLQPLSSIQSVVIAASVTMITRCLVVRR